MRFKATLCDLRQLCAILNEFCALISIHITIQTYRYNLVYGGMGFCTEIEINRNG